MNDLLRNLGQVTLSQVLEEIVPTRRQVKQSQPSRAFANSFIPEMMVRSFQIIIWPWVNTVVP